MQQANNTENHTQLLITNIKIFVKVKIYLPNYKTTHANT